MCGLWNRRLTIGLNRCSQFRMKAEGPDVTTTGGEGENSFLFACLFLFFFSFDNDRALDHNFLIFCSIRNLVLLLELSHSK